MRIGVFGTTGNPVHVLHLILADQAGDQLNMDEVLWMVTGVPTDKAPDEDKEVRCRLVQKAIAGNPRFKLSRLEVDRDGPSFTVDTMKAVRALYGEEHEFFLIMGEDRANDLHTFHDVETLVTLCTFAFGPRFGETLDREKVKAKLPPGAKFEIVEYEFASRFIRSRVKAGRSVRYMVPDDERADIEANRLYMPEAQKEVTHG